MSSSAFASAASGVSRAVLTSSDRTATARSSASMPCLPPYTEFQPMLNMAPRTDAQQKYLSKSPGSKTVTLTKGCTYEAWVHLVQAVFQLIQQRLPLIIQVVQIVGRRHSRCSLPHAENQHHHHVIPPCALHLAHLHQVLAASLKCIAELPLLSVGSSRNLYLTIWLYTPVLDDDQSRREIHAGLCPPSAC